MLQCRPGEESATSAPVPAPTFQPLPNATLAALLVKGINGTTYDLSTDFSSIVSQYGLMVSEEAFNATLCVQTANGELNDLGPALLRRMPVSLTEVSSTYLSLSCHTACVLKKQILKRINCEVAQDPLHSTCV